VAARPPAVTVLYDRDCGLCRVCVALLLRWDRRARLRPVAIQSGEGERLLESVAPDARLATAHAVTADGRVHSGGDAAAPIAAVLPGGAPLARIARAMPGLVRAGYGLVAGNRSRLGPVIPRAARERATGVIARRSGTAPPPRV
jgi:predicted DCC family thiol-disulfide oxidoreductase YuxK